ncbi:MAG: GNAT family protein [Micrococcus sp.]|nr:GNAT family protein [Micrococcus sp.]
MTRPTPVPAPPVPLRTERLSLRYFRGSDAGELLRYYGRQDTTRYLLDGPWDAARARHEVARRAGRLHITAAGFAVCLVVEEPGPTRAAGEDGGRRGGTSPGEPAGEGGGAVVGDITLWAVDDSLSLGEMSWVFDPDAGGRGLATEAARAVLDLAFGHYGMHRVRVRMDARNAASARLCERLGFRREGLLRRDWLIRGEWTDTLVYGMLTEERPR